MPVLSSELWTAIAVNKHVTKQITNTTPVKQMLEVLSVVQMFLACP